MIKQTRFCDICGNEIEMPQVLNTRNVSVYRYEVIVDLVPEISRDVFQKTKLDMCPDCMEKFRKFLEEEKVVQ